MPSVVDHCQGDAEKCDRDDFSSSTDVDCTVEVDKVASRSHAGMTDYVVVAAASCGRRRHAATFEVSVRSSYVAAVLGVVDRADTHRQIDDSTASRIYSASAGNAAEASHREASGIAAEIGFGYVNSNADLASLRVAFGSRSVIQLAQTTTNDVSI